MPDELPDDALGVCRREDARQAALTVPEREAEAYRLACAMADGRDRGRHPDREAHRAAFYARHGYDPDAQEG